MIKYNWMFKFDNSFQKQFLLFSDKSLINLIIFLLSNIFIKFIKSNIYIFIYLKPVTERRRF